MKKLFDKIIKKGQTLKFKVSLISTPPPPLHQCEYVMEDDGWKEGGEGFNKKHKLILFSTCCANLTYLAAAAASRCLLCFSAFISLLRIFLSWPPGLWWFVFKLASFLVLCFPRFIIQEFMSKTTTFKIINGICKDDNYTSVLGI